LTNATTSLRQSHANGRRQRGKGLYLKGKKGEDPACEKSRGERFYKISESAKGALGKAKGEKRKEKICDKDSSRREKNPVARFRPSHIDKGGN